LLQFPRNRDAIHLIDIGEEKYFFNNNPVFDNWGFHFGHFKYYEYRLAENDELYIKLNKNLHSCIKCLSLAQSGWVAGLICVTSTAYHSQ
jgi:hypothetical protein